MKRGQYYRLLLSTAENTTKVIAAAKTMALHGSAQIEESSTKDTTGDALEQDVTGLSYDISGSALILTDNDPLGGNTANTLGDMISLVSDTLLYWRICLMEGTNNRTVVSTVCSGTAKLTQLNPTGQVKQTAQYSYTLRGYDAINVGDGASS